MDAARTEIARHLEILEREFGDGEYLGSDRFSLADIAYLPFLHFLPMMEIDPGPRIAAWRTRLLARPSALATVPAQ